MSQLRCITPNPDISGIGVRTATYAQALLTLVRPFLAALDGTIDEHELGSLHTTYLTILLPGCALLIAAFVQASTFGISAFHGIVTLNLSWVTFANFTACRRLLCAFPGLKDLTLWEVRWRHWVPYGAMVYFIGNVPRVVRLSLGLFAMAVSVPLRCQCFI